MCLNKEDVATSGSKCVMGTEERVQSSYDGLSPTKRVNIQPQLALDKTFTWILKVGSLSSSVLSSACDWSFFRGSIITFWGESLVFLVRSLAGNIKIVEDGCEWPDFGGFNLWC